MKHKARSVRHGTRLIKATSPAQHATASALDTVLHAITAQQTFTTMYCGIETDTTGNYTYLDDYDCEDCLREYGLVVLGELE